MCCLLKEHLTVYRSQLAIHPLSNQTVLQEYLNDYGDDEARRIGEQLIAKESAEGLSDSAKRMLDRKMAKVNSGEHDVYI
jgi:hypothetical protein